MSLLRGSPLLTLGLLAALSVFTVSNCAKDVSVMNEKQSESIVLGMGCFWGAEKRMSEIPGVLDVESGYANGEVDGSYEAVLLQEKLRAWGKSGKRNHAEVVKVTFDPSRVTLETVLIKFWENHDPTQGDRQGNDIGSNYRSAVYTVSDDQMNAALKTKEIYQSALKENGFGPVTTEIAPLTAYFSAEEYHQDYLKKNPNGYCGLGGTGVRYPLMAAESGPEKNNTAANHPRLRSSELSGNLQLIVFEADGCAFCEKFRKEILSSWRSDVPVKTSKNPLPPEGWTLSETLFATPTSVLFKNGKEISRYTGYNGDKAGFWKWLGFHLLTPEQQKIAFESGTERPGTGSHLDEKRPGTFADPITGAPLFRTDGKFESGTGWPSFFTPVPGSVTLHEDYSHGMARTEVRSASSGIHLGHVFDDGPPPTYKRYCINGNVLKFIPD